jgi:4-hydroxy-tetrahydrodipicolinate synthase
LTRHAVASGTFGCLMLPPFFLKGVPDQGIIDAYRWVIDAVADPRLRIVLYHIPQVSGVGLSHHVIRTLKDVYPDDHRRHEGQQRPSARARSPTRSLSCPSIQVWVGNEPRPGDERARQHGAVSGVANVLPRLINRLVTRHEGPDARARRAARASLHRRARRLRHDCGLQGRHGDPRRGCRLASRAATPLVALSDAEFERLVAQMRDFAVGPRPGLSRWPTWSASQAGTPTWFRASPARSCAARTVMAHSFAISPGGKGSNAAIACVRARTCARA